MLVPFSTNRSAHAVPAMQDAVHDLDQRKPGVGGEIPS